MAAEAATPARADVIDEVFQERGITEPTPTPPAPAESKPPVPPIADPAEGEAVLVPPPRTQEVRQGAAIQAPS